MTLNHAPSNAREENICSFGSADISAVTLSGRDLPLLSYFKYFPTSSAEKPMCRSPRARASNQDNSLLPHQSVWDFEDVCSSKGCEDLFALTGDLFAWQASWR